MLGRSNLRLISNLLKLVRKPQDLPLGRLRLRLTLCLVLKGRVEQCAAARRDHASKGWEVHFRFGTDYAGKGERDAAAWVWDGSSLSSNIPFIVCIEVAQDLSQKEGADAKEKLYRIHLVLFSPQATHFGVYTFVWYIQNIFVNFFHFDMTAQYFGQNNTKPANVHTGEKCRKENML